MYLLKLKRFICCIFILTSVFVYYISPAKALTIKNISQTSNIINNCQNRNFLNINVSKCGDNSKVNNNQYIVVPTANEKQNVIESSEELFQNKEDLQNTITQKKSIDSKLFAFLSIAVVFMLLTIKKLINNRDRKINQRIENLEIIATK